MPPSTSMTAISTGVSNSTVLMKSCSSTPATTAGRNASRTPATKRRAPGSTGSARAIASSRPKYTVRIARIAPSWISTSNALPVDSKPRKWPASRMWPVDETGMNSVSPSMTPRTAATR